MLARIGDGVLVEVIQHRVRLDHESLQHIRQPALEGPLPASGQVLSDRSPELCLKVMWSCCPSPNSVALDGSLVSCPTHLGGPALSGWYGSCLGQGDGSAEGIEYVIGQLCLELSHAFENTLL